MFALWRSCATANRLDNSIELLLRIFSYLPDYNYSHNRSWSCKLFTAGLSRNNKQQAAFLASVLSAAQ